MHAQLQKKPNQKGVEARTSRPWHARRCLGPFALYDVRGRETVPPGSASLVNRAEAAFVIELYR
jgi:senataxin